MLQSSENWKPMKIDEPKKQKSCCTPRARKIALLTVLTVALVCVTGYLVFRFVDFSPPEEKTEEVIGGFGSSADDSESDDDYYDYYDGEEGEEEDLSDDVHTPEDDQTPVNLGDDATDSEGGDAPTLKDEIMKDSRANEDD